MLFSRLLVRKSKTRKKKNKKVFQKTVLLNLFPWLKVREKQISRNWRCSDET
nr:MAG TPA: hypothetical protein [Caudoviricetes sp.]